MISDEAVEAAVHAYMQYPRTRGIDNTENMFRAALEAAAPYMLGDPQAQAIEDVLIDFGRESVFLTAAQESMARFLRARVAELRSK